MTHIHYYTKPTKLVSRTLCFVSTDYTNSFRTIRAHLIYMHVCIVPVCVNTQPRFYLYLLWALILYRRTLADCCLLLLLLTASTISSTELKSFCREEKKRKRDLMRIYLTRFRSWFFDKMYIKPRDIKIILMASTLSKLL